MIYAFGSQQTCQQYKPLQIQLENAEFELDSTVICQCLQKYSRICFSLIVLASQVNDSGVPALIYNYINYSAGCFVI